MSATAFLEKLGVPVNSHVAAGVHMNRNLPTVDRANEILEALTGETLDPSVSSNAMFVPFVAAYAVQTYVRNLVRGEVMDRVDLLASARAEAEAKLEEFAWTFATDGETTDIENVEPEVVKAGKAKKGARKVLALRVYNEKIKDAVAEGTMTRKVAISILVDEVGLSAAGASTYYANFKSGKWA